MFLSRLAGSAGAMSDGVHSPTDRVCSLLRGDAYRNQLPGNVNVGGGDNFEMEEAL